jgi:hypothetical protein
MVKKIPGETIKAINSKVGFRFVTKFGEKGVVNLGKVVPVLGGVIGGTLDVASTKIIGNNVYKIFKSIKIYDVIVAEISYLLTNYLGFRYVISTYQEIIKLKHYSLSFLNSFFILDSFLILLGNSTPFTEEM